MKETHGCFSELTNPRGNEGGARYLQFRNEVVAPALIPIPRQHKRGRILNAVYIWYMESFLAKCHSSDSMRSTNSLFRCKSSENLAMEEEFDHTNNKKKEILDPQGSFKGMHVVHIY
jgi:hypothetical protein